MAVLLNRVETMISWRGIVVSGKAQASQLRKAALAHGVSLRRLELSETATLFRVSEIKKQKIEATLAESLGFSRALARAQMKLFFSPQKVGSRYRLDLRDFLSLFPNLQGFVPSAPASQAALLARSYIGWRKEMVAALPVVTAHEATGIRVGICFPSVNRGTLTATGSALLFGLSQEGDFSRADETDDGREYKNLFLEHSFGIEIPQSFYAELTVGKENRDGQPDLIWQAEEIDLALATFEQIKSAYQA